MKLWLCTLCTYVLIFIFLYLIFHNLFFQNIETFDVGKSVKKGVEKTGKNISKNPDKIENVANKASDVAKKGGDVVEKGGDIAEKTGSTIQKGISQLNPIDAIKQLVKIVKEVKQNVDDINKEIKNMPTQINDTVTGKFTNVFAQLGDVLNNGLVKPLNALFVGIGNIFMQIFGIFTLIGNKITSLPGCILYFIFDGIFASIYGIFKLVLPNFIISWIINPIANGCNVILDFIGYNSASRKCYAFNVDDEVSKMSNNLNNIDSSFKKDFGNLDFSKISF